MASITVDIQAKVVGYEASLKAMKDAFSKIDPGSDIGKSLEKAIKYAEGQLKNLNKNLNPKASSDTQIDSIIEKTNRAGEAIQEVSALMQKVTFGDIDFSSFENGISNLMSTLRDLESELDSRISKGLQETIINSSDLIDSFSKLNIDVKDKSAGQIFEAVSEKAKQAAEDTETARAKLEAAQKNLNSQQGKLNQLESNPIYNKDVLKQDLQNIAVEYTKTFDDIKNKIQEGLKGLLGSDSVQADKLMDNFMNGLNPQTLKDHLMQLKNELQQELSENNSAKDIYTALLGDAGQSGNAQAITTKLLSSLNQSLPQMKEELQNKVQDFISSLTNKEAGQITTLINLGDIEKAVKTTVQAVERAYDSVKGAVVKKRADVASALKGQETAQADFDTAQQNQQYIEGIQANLQKQIDDLTAKNSALQEKIDQLVKQIQEKKETEEKSIHKTAIDNGFKAGSLKVSADEARMYRTELEQVQAKEKLIGKIEGVVQRWFSIYAAVRMVGNAIRSVISTVQELDKTITEIAIVTDMTQNDLWGQMKSYTDMAREYAASISGVYQVSQLYYQQGLQTADVMALTEETLKMARISGLDYAQATDYMTNAVRSFKMEMTDAQNVVDVYSAIAASSATSTSELASAMSKTASSAEAVGSSFENTTAMMAVMIEATRESPENIGSAMKSIISRYGEMTADPSKLVDSEGQEMSLNKVDKALQSVGITIQDTNHQFRDFDDVITELAGKWDTIDKNTQRYIATVMAGNRQQSRFLALVSSGERLEELSEIAANSEDAATLQVLKTMDSIEAKSQQLKTSLQSLYTSTGIQNLFKGFLDTGNQIVKTFTQMPTILGAPIPAILKIGTTFASLANVVTTVFGMIKAKTRAQIAALNGQEQVAAQERISIANFEESEKEILEMKRLSLHQLINGEISQSDFKLARQEIEIYRQKLEEEKQLAQQANAQLTGGTKGGLIKQSAAHALGLNIAGVALSTISGAISDKTQSSKILKGLTGIAGSAASMAGMGMMMGGPAGAGIGAVLGGVMGIVENINFLFESAEARAQRLKKAATEANNTYLQKKSDYKNLQNEVNELKKLEEARYDSAEANQAYLDASNALAEKTPELISYIDSEGNAVLDLSNSYEVLRQARLDAAESAVEAGRANIEKAKEDTRQADVNYQEALGEFVNLAFSAQGDFSSFVDSGENRLLQDFMESSQYQEFIGTNGNDSAERFLDSFVTVQFADTGINYSAEEYQEAMRLLAEGENKLKNASNNLVNNAQSFKDVAEQYEDIQDSSQLDSTDKALKEISDAYVELINAGDDTSKRQAAGEKLFDAINNNKEILDKIVAGEIEENIPISSDDIQTLLNAAQKAKGAKSKSVKAQIAQDLVELENIKTQIWLSAQEILDSDSLNETDPRKKAEIEAKKTMLQEMPNANDLITRYIESQYKGLTDQAAKDKYTEEDGGFQQDYDDISKALATFYSGLSTETAQNFSSLIENKGKYTQEQLIAKIEEETGKSLDDEIIQALSSYYAEALDQQQVKQILDDRVTKIDRSGSEIEALLTKNDILGADEWQKIVDVYDNLVKQQKQGDMTPDQTAEALNAYAAIWNQFDPSKNLIPEDKIDEISKIFEDWNDYSIPGLDSLRSSLKATQLDETTINQLMELATSFANLIPENLAIDFETMSKQMISQSEDFEKALKNASQGMDLKEATQMAERLDVSLKDFDFKSGKYFFTNANAIKDAYYKYNDETIEALNEQYINELNTLGKEYKDANTSDKRKQEIFDKAEQLKLSHDNLIATIEQYGEYQVNSVLIQNGFIEDFLTDVLGEEADIEGQKELISKGDYTSLDNKIKPYITELQKLTNNLTKNVFDSAINSVSSGESIVIDTTNGTEEQRALIESLGGELIKGTQSYLLKLNKENIENSVAVVKDALNKGIITQKSADSYLKQLHDIEFEDNLTQGFEGLVNKYDEFSYDAAQTFLRSVGDLRTPEEAFGEANVAGNFSLAYDQMSAFLDWKMKELGDKKYNELRAQLDKKEREQSDTSVMSAIIQNRDKLSEENVQSLANMLDMTYNNVLNGLHQNADGTYSISLADIVSLIQSGKTEVSQTVYDLLAEQIDNTIGSINKIVSSQSKGFTEIGDMQNYVKQLREAGIKNVETDSSFTLDELFDFNDALHAYQLSETGIIANIKGMKGQLEELRKRAYTSDGTIIDQNAVDQYNAAMQLVNDAPRQFAEAIDISGFLATSIGDPSKTIKTQELRKAIDNYNAALIAIGETEGLNTDNIIATLQFGGEDAVRAAEAIAEAQGTTLSAEDVEAAYRSQISNWVNAIDTVMAKPGEIVDQATAEIIGISGGAVNELGDTGQFVVESAANLYEAYNNLLQQMTLSGEATLADLNKVQALALENRDGEQPIIDALGDAAGMTFTRFGEILADAGIQLTEDMVNNLETAKIIDLMGGNKMKIIDFQAFADLMNWDANSEEYVSAFKSYNDSLIDMNRQAERNILEEAQNVASAKGGDWINLTQLSTELEKQVVSVTQEGGNAPIIKTGLDRLNEALQKYGAQIEDGILKLGPSANIPAIMQEIAQAAAESGDLLSNELAELADAVADAIKGYADLISGGIEGSLSNVQAEELQDWATANGIGKLDFTETADGLKVATDQAFELVAALRQVDSMQGKLTFDSLVDSLSADKGGKFENISKTTAEIAKAQREIAENNQKIDFLQKDDEKTNAKDIQILKEKNAKLREQIGLYREIQQHQSIDSSQYNFMDRELPEVMQGPINYWNSVGQAFSVMNESAKTGKMGIQDFYNIVNEMSNLIAVSGQPLELAGVQLDGSAERAAELIQKGMSSLTNIDGKGVMINLENLGIDFASGADGAKQNFADGVNALAESQIAMLDAAIKVLEVVVAMEQLGDIDVTEDNQLNLGEIFTLDDSGIPTDWNKTYTDAVGELLEKAEKDKELSDALESVKIGGRSMMEYLKDTEKTFTEASAEWEKLGMSTEMYQQVMNGFYQAMAKGDYNLDTIQDSVWETLANYLPDGMTIELPDRTIVVVGGEKFTIDWQKPEVQNAVDMIEKEKEITEEEAKAELEKYFLNFQTGKTAEDPLEVLYVLNAEGKIELIFDKKGNPKIKSGDKEIDPSSKEGQEIIAKAALEEKGIDPKGTFSVNTKEGPIVKAVGTTKIGEAEISVESDGEGSVVYKDPKTGLTANTLEELENKMIEKWINENPNKEGGAPTSYEARQALFGINVKPKVEVKTELDTPQLKQQAASVAKMSTDKLKELIEGKNNNYEVLEPTLEGYVRYNLGGIEVEVEDTGDFEKNLQAAQDKVASLVDNIDLIGNISEAITNAFTKTDGTGNAIQEAITTAIQNAFKITELPEQEIPEINAKIAKLNITSVGSAAFGRGGLFGKAFSTVSKILGGSNLTIPSADAKIDTLNITNAGTVDTSKMVSIGEQIAASLQAGLSLHPLTPTIDTSSSNGGDNSSKDSGDNGSSKHKRATDAYSTQPKTPEVPQVDTSWAATLSSSMSQLAGAASVAAGGLAVAQHALDGIKTEKISSIQTELDTIKSDKVTAIQTAQDAIKSDKVTAIQTAQDAIKHDKVTAIQTAQSSIKHDKIDAVRNAISGIKAPSSLTSSFKISVSKAKGNMPGVANAKGSNLAMAGGTRRTLMGELGPELVVSNSRYFLVGQNGAEFVDLASDAIVFNHLQTRRLMEQGAIGSRGKPTTNERTAVAFAKGKHPEIGPAANKLMPDGGTGTPTKEIKTDIRGSVIPTQWKINWLKGSGIASGGRWGPSLLDTIRTSAAKGTGPAMASASAALAALKQLRAMWQSLANASLQDMGGMPGGSGGGGGGGGGGGSDETQKEVAGINQEVERWYNWLKLIETTQDKINILTKKYDLMTSQGFNSKELANNLREQYKNLQLMRGTSEALIDEQKKYRANFIKKVTKKDINNPFSAFYNADKETGKITLANDDAFKKYITERKLTGELANQMKTGQITKGKEITREVSSEEVAKLFKEDYGSSKNVPSYLKKYYDKNGKIRNGQEKKVKAALTKNNTQKVKVSKTIKTGLDFMEELQATDEFGNLIHNAGSQLALIKQMGFLTNDLMAGVDKEDEGWEATVVQNFYDKIENDKAEIEALNQSIQEQTEAALDDAKAMQEINDKLREIYTPIVGITEGIDKWYNTLRSIVDLQNKYNTLTKQANNLEKDAISNGKDIYNNLVKQTDVIRAQQELNNQMIKERVAANKELANTGLSKFFSITDSGSAIFDEVINETLYYKQSDRVATTKGWDGKQYQVDELGRYVDQNGDIYNKDNQKLRKIENSELTLATNKDNKQLTTLQGRKLYNLNGSSDYYFYDANGNLMSLSASERDEKKAKVAQGEFGQLKINSGGISTFNTDGKNIIDILEKLTEQDKQGRTNYTAEEQYEILRNLNLESFMQYDDKGNQIYDQFGQLTQEEMEKAVQAGIDRLKKVVEDINENNDEIVKAEQENLDLTSSLLDIQAKLRDINIQVEQALHDAIVNERQELIDTRTDLKDAIANAADKTVEGLNNSLAKEKQTIENNKGEQDLAKLQNQLAMLQASNGSLAKIRSVQDQIQAKQQEIYFNKRQQAIDNIEEASNKQVEALEAQIDLMQTSLDYQVEQGLLWGEVRTRLNTWTENQIIDYIRNADNEYLQKAPSEREQWYTELADKIGILIANQEKAIDTTSKDETNRDTKVSKAGELGQLTNGNKEQIVKNILQGKNSQNYNTAQLTSDIEKYAAQGFSQSEIEKKINLNNYKKQSTPTVPQEQKKEEKKPTQTTPTAPSTPAKSSTSAKPKDPIQTSFTDYIAQKKYSLSDAEKDTLYKTYKEQYERKGELFAQNDLTTGIEAKQAYNKAITKKYDKKKNPNGIKGFYTYASKNVRGKEALEYYYINRYKKGDSPNAIAKDLKSNSKAQRNKIIDQYFKDKKLYYVYIPKNTKYYSGWDAKNAKPTGGSKTVSKNTQSIIDQNKVQYNSKKKYLLVDGKYYSANKNSKLKIRRPSNISLSKLPTFATGGKIDFTGPAWVDGTKNKPEHIFNYDQMEQLKNMFFDSLATTQAGIAGLSSIVNNIPNTNSYSSINNEDNGINIGQLDFHMEVKEIANDYDARRAGREAMEEMVRIARKTGNRSVSRR